MQMAILRRFRSSSCWSREFDVLTTRKLISLKVTSYIVMLLTANFANVNSTWDDSYKNNDKSLKIILIL